MRELGGCAKCDILSNISLTLLFLNLKALGEID